MGLTNNMQHYAADQKKTIEQAGRIAGIKDPVAFDPSYFFSDLMEHSTRGPVLPLEGLLVRDWNPYFRRTHAGVTFGVRGYRIEGIPFARIQALLDEGKASQRCVKLFIVGKEDYLRLYRVAYRLFRQPDKKNPPPVMEAEIQKTIWQNTIGYLDPKNLNRIKEFGGRPKRGLLLYGPPGNGKTSVCRWLMQECLERSWEWKQVTAEAYQTARCSQNPIDSIGELFTVEDCGIVFFDDMDMALRNRDNAPAADDQSIFLNALDGMTQKEGVVYIFATNCPLDRIDPAFRRPGRIDIVLMFQKPNESLRRRLLDRWHAEIRGNLDISTFLKDTAEMSFAEIEELKNLLVLHYIDSNEWNWGWAIRQFRSNREEFNAKPRGPLGYFAALNGHN
ncbi:ATP-binding protein [Telmatocola sphagniphila]|uniref:ATP-binding protein n=1 Tax=Telmatocola sphagniphila TaxID=1123043 RepID=A0A8E6B459_9BACT|nr:ATP-binding protein [Telmatocola sphagniphila]QVL31557.1 ATP-binding protein [Telmatocola sphagniphila]